MKLFICGNGNIPFDTFLEKYIEPIERLCDEIDIDDIEFILCEFRGLDILMLEYLKTKSKNVTVLYMRNNPRYKPDEFRTFVKEWHFIGEYSSNLERDLAAIDMCTHFLAYDTNSDHNRMSGTLKNIKKCLSLGKREISFHYC